MAGYGRRQPLPRNARRIPVPAVALERWLAEIDDPAELKVTLRVVGLLALAPMRGEIPPSLSLDELLDDAVLRSAAGLANDDAIRQAAAKALARETLTAARIGGELRLFLNDQRCGEYLSKMQLLPLEASDVAPLPVDEKAAIGDAPAVASVPVRANIFALYEQHVGAFGHGMAEQLKAAEEEYPASWIADAFAIASEQDIRSWGYVHAILRRWLQEGKRGAASTTVNRQRDQRHDDGKPGHDLAPDSRTGYLESYRRRYGRLPWESDDTSCGTDG